LRERTEEGVEGMFILNFDGYFIKENYNINDLYSSQQTDRKSFKRPSFLKTFFNYAIKGAMTSWLMG
jgi:hypothetical protein